MSKIRIPWHLLAALILGFGLGLVISWIIAPLAYTDTPPALLRADFKDDYRVAIAAAYASTGDLARAQSRLAELEDPNPIEALESQAQRALAGGSEPASLSALTLLATDLEQNTTSNQVTPTSTRFLTQTSLPPTQTGTPPTPTRIAITKTPATATETPVPLNSATPKPTYTASPTLGAPYIIDTQDEICSTNISEGLLMVYLSDAAQKPVPGTEIIVSWEGGEEHFFTGLKPELGNGYADFTMQSNISYTLRLPNGNVAVAGLSAPPCQDSEGRHYWGSLRIRLKQP